MPRSSQDANKPSVVQMVNKLIGFGTIHALDSSLDPLNKLTITASIIIAISVKTTDTHGAILRHADTATPNG